MRPLVLSAATWVPSGRETVDEMLVAGRLAVDDTQGLALTEVPVADRAAPDMAVLAGRRALEASGVDPGRVGLVAHAWTYHQGHDFWSPAHYVARHVGAHAAFPVGVQQLSNGGAAALGMAVRQLIASPETDAALVTTADRFAWPGFDRWAADYGVVYGDAGTAAVLHRRDDVRPSGALLLKSLAFATDASFEDMYRGRDAFSPAPLARDGGIDVRRPKKAYLEIHGGIERFRKAATGCVDEVLRRALHEADVDPADPRLVHVLLPRLSDSTLDLMYRPVVGSLLKADVLDLREASGHLGAGDLLANLAHLTSPGVLHPGERAVVLGGGGGFTWSCAVVEGL
ncbi:ketoacyl-ACP synthase III family protein [Streptomyces cavernicola]|uniref:Ketoacyl-ACP synthase III family protein n=1 Tax=Streptomyces cavernicola TaxID=3043613 RepID=A0ABT6SJU8_9ACTN|nr:ketoacyl-ACP synthase III family protein [Streptomyces sp. B-S-A6]MDI3408225.1 ketoacyl-ACP synthase III family protein [Streptomyces sp. B-S-A6]